MSRSNRHQWKERTRPPVQAADVAGAVPLDQVAAGREQQAALIRARVENLAAAIYAQNINGAVDDAGQFDREYATAVAGFSIDAALLFAGQVWGIQGQRVQNGPAPKPVQPVAEPARREPHVADECDHCDEPGCDGDHVISGQ